MRKKLLVILLLVLVIAGGGYGALWFVQASQAQQQVETLIARINAKQPYVTYESIGTSGFLSDVVVTIHKPHFTGRVDTILKELFAYDQKSASDFSTMPEWTADLALDGDISIRINMLSDHYVMTTSGSWKNTNTMGGVTESVSSKPMGDTVCNLKMQRSDGLLKDMWNLKLARDGQKFSDDFRELDCIIPASSVADASGAVLTSNGDGRFFVSNMPASGSNQVRFYLKSIDSEITAAGDKWFETYMRALFPGATHTSKFSAYGKQNIEVDFTMTAPSDGANLMTAPLDINLSKFVLTNQVYNTNAVFQLASSVNGDSRSGKLLLKAESNFGEQYDVMMQDILRSMIDDIYKGNNPQYANLKPMFDKYTPDQAFAIIAPALPNFHSMGKTVQNIDLTYQGNAMLTSGDFNIATFEVSTSLYGISGNGTGKMAPGQLSPASNVTLTCSNCLRLVDDVAAYMGRVQKAVAAFDENAAAAMVIDPRAVEGFKNFLAALAEPSKDAADKSAFTYTIVSDGMMSITISGKPIDQVMALYMEHVGSVMQPAAGQPAQP